MWDTHLITRFSFLRFVLGLFWSIFRMSSWIIWMCYKLESRKSEGFALVQIDYEGTWQI